MKTNKSNYLHILTEELKSPGKGFLDGYDGYLRPFIVASPLDLTASLKSFLAMPGLNADDARAATSWEPPKR
jgi:hypothetical protein